MRHLLLSLLEILTVFSIQELRITTFYLVVVLLEALVVNQVLECLADFLKVNGLVVFNRAIDIRCSL